MLYNRDEEKIKDLQWMGFLKLNSEHELTDQYTISKKEARNFLKLVDLFIRIARVNVFFLYFFCLGLHLRVLIVAQQTLSTSAFLFSTLPNLFSFWIPTIAAWQSVNCFFVLFVLTTSFIQKNLKSCVDYDVSHLPTRKKRFNKLARVHANCLNEMLAIYKSSHEHIQYSLSTLYSFAIFAGFSFPYVGIL